MTPKCVELLIDTLEIESTAGSALIVLALLAEKHPELLEPYADTVISQMEKDKNIASQGGNILVHLADSPVSSSHGHTQLSLSLLNTTINLFYICL